MDPVSEMFVAVAALMAEVHRCHVEVDWDHYHFNIIGCSTERAMVCASNLEKFTTLLLGKRLPVKYLSLSES